MLWGSRLVVLVAVVPGVMLASATFYLATAEALRTLRYLARYADPALAAEERDGVRADALGAAIGTALGAAEWYLLAATLIVFALGLYELFVGELEAAPRLLRVRGLGQFVGRIGGLVLLMLVMEFVRSPARSRYDGGPHFLYLAIGVLIVGGALYAGTGGPSGGEPEG